MTNLRTTEDWLKLKEYSHITMLDPTGWPEDDFITSWYSEKISELEFHKRLINSTVRIGEIKDENY